MGNVSVCPNFYYNFLVLLNHYFSENNPVGPHFPRSGIQLKGSFSSCAL